MADKENRKRDKSKKSSRPKQAIRNRYHLHAKLSEYKFLKILRGFCDGGAAADIASQTNISEKTIRFTYKLLRNQLFLATMNDLKAFGGAGFFLFDKEGLSERGRAFLQSIQESPLFLDHMQKHAPRTKKPEEVRDYLFEVAVRLFCNLAMSKDTETLYSKETREALVLVREISQWLRTTNEHGQMAEQYKVVVTRFKEVVMRMPELLVQEELLALKNKSVEHRFPSTVLYDDLRSFTLKSPLQG